MTRSKRLVFSVLVFVLACVAIEGISWIGLALLPSLRVRRTVDIYQEQSAQIRQLLDPSGPRLVEIDRVLGWRYAANYVDATHQLNSKALRSAREYSPTAPPNVIRVAAFGSSIVYCSEVDNPNAWPALIETTNGDMQVLNYGVGGYGTDQAYLRYLSVGADLSPHVVLIGFTSDELGRTVNVNRRLISTLNGISFKPRFLIDARGELTLLDVPVRERADYERILTNPREVIRFREHDQWYQPCVYESPIYDYSAAVRMGCQLASEIDRRYLNPDRLVRGQVFNETSTAFRIQVALFQKFSEAVRRSGAIPIVVLLPEKESLQRGLQGGPKLYDPLLPFLREHGVDYVDAIEAFRGTSAAELNGLFASGGHYSPLGNKAIASWLPGEIRKRVSGRR